MRSPTTHQLFRSLPPAQRHTAISKILSEPSLALDGNQGTKFMLMNELCLVPYHTTSVIIFLESTISQDYQHFFVRCSSMMTEQDLGEFI